MNDLPVYLCTRLRWRRREQRRRRRARVARIRRRHRIMRNQLYNGANIPLTFEGLFAHGAVIFT